MLREKKNNHTSFRTERTFAQISVMASRDREMVAAAGLREECEVLGEKATRKKKERKKKEGRKEN